MSGAGADLLKRFRTRLDAVRREVTELRRIAADFDRRATEAFGFVARAADDLKLLEAAYEAAEKEEAVRLAGDLAGKTMPPAARPEARVEADGGVTRSYPLKPFTAGDEARAEEDVRERDRKREERLRELGYCVHGTKAATCAVCKRLSGAEPAKEKVEVVIKPKATSWAALDAMVGAEENYYDLLTRADRAERNSPFVKSCWDFYNRTGRLSVKQVEALKRKLPREDVEVVAPASDDNNGDELPDTF